jgi:hypothetical protein
MLKIRANALVLFGITEENVRRLREDKPMLIDGSEIGLAPLRFGIVLAPDNGGLLRKIEEHGGIKVPDSVFAQAALDDAEFRDSSDLFVCNECGSVRVRKKVD